jgi:hypothetical protein
MNPVPVIATEVSAEPAMAEDGEMEAMAGVGFWAGGGGVVEVIPPPQPDMKEIKDRTEVRRTHLERFIMLLMEETKDLKQPSGNARNYTGSYSLCKYLTYTYPNFKERITSSRIDIRLRHFQEMTSISECATR